MTRHVLRLAPTGSPVLMEHISSQLSAERCHVSSLKSATWVNLHYRNQQTPQHGAYSPPCRAKHSSAHHRSQSRCEQFTWVPHLTEGLHYNSPRSIIIFTPKSTTAPSLLINAPVNVCLNACCLPGPGLSSQHHIPVRQLSVLSYSWGN